MTGLPRRWPLFALVGYAFRTAPVLAAVTASGALVAGLAPVGITVATGALVNALSTAIGAGTASPAARECYGLVAVITALFLLTHLADSTRTAAGRALAHRVTGRLAERVMAAACEPATVGHLEDPAYLARIAGARGGGTIEIPPGEALFGFANKGSVWLTGIGSAALLAQLSWGLGLVVFVVFAVIYRRLAHNFRESVHDSAAQAGELRRTSYLRDVPTTPAAAKEVRVFGLTSLFRDAYHAEWRATMGRIWQRRHDHDGFVLVVVTVVGAAVGGVFWYLGYSVATGAMNAGGLAVGALAVRALLQLLSAGSDEIRISFGANAAAESFGFPAGTVSPAPADGWRTPVTEISCTDVCFRYPAAEEEALRDVTLSIPRGQSLAVVGLNGAGKTTLVRLLAGLDRPSAGRVAAGGTAVDDTNRGAWQRQVVAVFQEFGRYDLSLRDNIAFGSPANAEDFEGMCDVAAKAGLAEFVGRLPNGWDTVLSSGYEGGVDLSGGEWQRIAMARALFGLRHGAQLLVLDEPAASLDVRAEARLYDTFHELTEGVTTIVISHRFATVRKAERVVVLEHGRVVEDGPHDSLIADDRRYAELFRLQARRFEEAAS
ncbi:ABC transporter ATP-binding protein [Amycolatopsis sp. A133]|uniref:ABC transporter ATP-binding protein n=1 Tax=Amycolatopsis sp. A133 TaxID=3064472 RepID=UPI0027E96E2E|nr:ABC transporter ATP-binding protein [Amycolatopsis sp. A133]MDQ7803466.1 ABC transporter ATP-binding protein [Amycolatopsis sp. A133]